MRLFLAPHRLGHVPRRVPEERFLNDAPSRFDQRDLPVDFVGDCLLHVAEGVQILDLGLRAEGCLAARTDRDVRVAAEAPLLHVAVADIEVDDDLLQFREVVIRLLAGADVGLRHDLDQRDPGAIEIDAGGGDPFLAFRMERFPRVLLEVDPDEADSLLLAAHMDVDRTPLAEGTIVLGDLVALRKVRVEVVLSREDAPRVDRRADRESGHDGEFDGPLVQDREHAREPEANRTDLSIRRRAEGGGAGAEDLRVRLQLRVNLEPDHRLVLRAHRVRGHGRLVHRAPPPPATAMAGAREAASCSRS